MTRASLRFLRDHIARDVVRRERKYGDGNYGYARVRVCKGKR